MKNLSALLFFSLILFTSCGKSPLAMKVSDSQKELSELENVLYLTTTGQSVALKWLTPLSSTGEMRAQLTIKKNNLPEDLSAPFNIYLWMPSMGHGSAPITIKQTATGVYELETIYFIMDGDWELRVQLMQGSNTKEEIAFFYMIK